MDLEQQIKDLERQLALKKAYLSAEVKLPKSVPEDIRLEIEQSIKEFCTLKADGKSVPESGTNVPETSTIFTAQEIAILKGVVQAAMEKSGVQVAPAVAKAVKKEEPLKAILMTTDNIPVERRKLVESNAEVTIVSYNDKEACFMHKRNRFVVPIEDLQFQTQGESK